MIFGSVTTSIRNLEHFAHFFIEQLFNVAATRINWYTESVRPLQKG